jgi:hypothetical protein
MESGSRATHECPGPGCERRMPVHMLACKRHWYQVSAATRSRVWKAWANGAGAGTVEHTEAIFQAMAEMRP